MRLVSCLCAIALSASGCSIIQVHLPKPKAPLLHAYKPLPQSLKVVDNLNADQDGDAWMVGGLVLPTDEELEGVPTLSLQPRARSAAGALPSAVDNSQKKYFRGIFAQKHGSCAQASGIAYVYGYEVNRMRNAAADAPERRFPTHWTYNFVNRGRDSGSWMMWGWEVAKSLGVPNANVYGTETGFNLQHWPSDFKVYENAIDNRVRSYFIMSMGTKATLDGVKRYLWNHGAEGNDGGILSIAAGWSTGYAEARIPEGQHGAGKKLITSFGAAVNHAVTLVGYDDDICHDFNGDGKCTDDVDLNGDGKLDLKDWENGAFIMANSWGTGWGNAGFIYIPYRLAALDPKDGGIYRQYAYGVNPRADEDKELVLRVKMQHDKRDQLRILSSYKRTKDNKTPLYYRYYGLQASGGAYPLNGKDNEPVSFGLDLKLLLGNENLKHPLDVGSVVDAVGGVGKILSVEVLDYMNDFIIEADEKDVDITRGRNVVEAAWDPDGEPDPDPTPDPPKPCQVGPVALAGHDMVVGEYCALALDATKSYDGDGGALVQYQWRQLYGPRKLKITNADKPVATVLIPEVRVNERYMFNVAITDNDGYTASDSVGVVVMNRFE